VDGSATLTVAQWENLAITPPADSDADFDLSITATSVDGNDSASTSQTLSVTVTPLPKLFDNTGNTVDFSTVGAGEYKSSSMYDAKGGADNVTFGESTESSFDATQEFHGSGGSDQITGNSADNTIYGDAGRDTLYGEGGDDYLYGGGAKDKLYGGEGDDYLDAGAGNKDAMYGGDGNDTLVVGSGRRDKVYGEAGDDSIIFELGSGTKNEAYGGEGWVDTISLSDVTQGPSGNANAEGSWVLQVDKSYTGEVVTDASNALNFVDEQGNAMDASGTIELSDGSKLSFEDVERIEWYT